MIQKRIIFALFLMKITSVFSQNQQRLSEFVTQKKLHPYSVTVELSNLTQPILDDIKKMYSKPALRAMTKIDAVDTRFFLEKNGFIPMRTTWTGEVELSKINVEPFEKALKEVQVHKWNVGIVSEKLLFNWLRHHKILYDVAHSINPLMPMSAPEITETFKDADFMGEFAYAVYRDTLVVAHGSLRKNNHDWDFGWFGATHTSDGLSESILNLAIKALEIRAAKKMGIEKIYIEYDSTDGQAMFLMPYLPITNPEIWITYQTKVASPFVD
jgi:hypothetical protein